MLIPRRNAGVWRAGDPVTRLEVPYSPVTVAAGERRDHQATLSAQLNWMGSRARSRVTTDPVPRVKEAYHDFWIDDEGRVWFEMYTTATLNPAAESAVPRPLSGSDQPDVSWPVRRWPELHEYDIVEPSGRFVGRVRSPDQLRLQAARGDTVWAVVLKDYTSITVKRYRIVWPDSGKKSASSVR